MAKSLTLVRHGLIEANRSGRWHGSTDSPLLWRGKRQAKRAAKRIAKHYPQPVAVYTSPLQRCQQTAALIAERLNIARAIVVNDLAEYDIGEWEDTPFKELAAKHDFINTAIADPAFAPPAGESLAQVAARTTLALRTIDEQHANHEPVIVVSHGAAMAVALATLLENTPGKWPDYSLHNCSCTELVIQPSPYLNYFNATEHL